MEKHVYDEKNGLSYTLCGDYYLPNLVLNEDEPTYGKYGILRKQFLKEYRPARYQYLLMTGCDRTSENAGSDEMGWFNEWHQSLCGRNCVEREGIYVSRKGSRKAALYKDENKNC